MTSTRMHSSYVRDEDLPGQRREAYWWTNVSAEKRAIKAELDTDKYLSEEFSLTFNPDDSHSINESLNGSRNDSFPIPLNPHFDLHALVWVS